MKITKDKFLELARNSCGVCVLIKTPDDPGAWVRIDGNLFADALSGYPQDYIKELFVDEQEVEGGTLYVHPGYRYVHENVLDACPHGENWDDCSDCNH